MKDLKQELEALSVSLNETKEAMNLSLNLMNSRIEEALKEAEVEPEEHKPTVRRIPFDVRKAKQGAKVVTASGEDVRILCYDRRSAFEIVALILHQDDEDEVILCTENGKTHVGHNTNNDLKILE